MVPEDPRLRLLKQGRAVQTPLLPETSGKIGKILDRYFMEKGEPIARPHRESEKKAIMRMAREINARNWGEAEERAERSTFWKICAELGKGEYFLVSLAGVFGHMMAIGQPELAEKIPYLHRILASEIAHVVATAGVILNLGAILVNNYLFNKAYMVSRWILAVNKHVHGEGRAADGKAAE
jgi:hypothetical protein